MTIETTPEHLPKKTTIAGETVEEHTLTDRLAYERYKNQQAAKDAEPVVGKFGIGIFRTRIHHGKP